MIEFSKVQKWYASQLALDIPLLQVPAGVYWLQGENGSGKTTFMKMIAGLHPFSGNIRLNTTDLKKQRVAFLQKVNYGEAEPLYPSFLTAKDMVELYCRTMKTDTGATRTLLEQLHIADAYDKPLGAWSSGMTKKLSIALAFTGNPEWILLDEPLITVDAEAVTIISQLVNERARNGTSFILTSHQAFPEDGLHITQKMIAANQTIQLPYV